MGTVKIALDGPAGAGKSTIAKLIARKLGYVYIDTGAMYRAAALFVLRRGLSPKDAAQVDSVLDAIEMDIVHDADGGQRVLLCGEDVSEEIRRPEVSMAASAVSAHPSVRIRLVELQRALAQRHDCIMDGRDIGTYVLPDAKIKIYLTADVEDRAARRCAELAEKGMPCSYDEILSDMKERDHNDMTRAFAPLCKAEDAVELNTTGNTLEQSVEAVYAAIRERLL